METQLKELDPEKIKMFGKLKESLEDLKELIIDKEKCKKIYKNFKTRY